MLVDYCAVCGTRLGSEDFRRGKAVHFGSSAYCKQHIPADQTIDHSPTLLDARQSPPGSPRTPAQIRIAARRRADRNLAQPPTRRRSSRGPVVVALLLLGAASALIAVFVGGGTGDAGNSPDPLADQRNSPNDGKSLPGPENSNGGLSPAAAAEELFALYQTCSSNLEDFRQHPPGLVDDRVTRANDQRKTAILLLAFGNESAEPAVSVAKLRALLQAWTDAASRAFTDRALAWVKTATGKSAAMTALKQFGRLRNLQYREDREMWPAWLKDVPAAVAELDAAAAASSDEWASGLQELRRQTSEVGRQQLDALRSEFQRVPDLIESVVEPSALDGYWRNVWAVGKRLSDAWQHVGRHSEHANQDVACGFLMEVIDAMASASWNNTESASAQAYQPGSRHLRVTLARVTSQWLEVFMLYIGRRTARMARLNAEFSNAAVDSPATGNRQLADDTDRLLRVLAERNATPRDILAPLMATIGDRCLASYPEAEDERSVQAIDAAFRELAARLEYTAGWRVIMQTLLYKRHPDADQLKSNPEPETLAEAVQLLADLRNALPGDGLRFARHLVVAELADRANWFDADDNSAAMRQLRAMASEAPGELQLGESADYRQLALARAAVCLWHNCSFRQRELGNRGVQHLQSAGGLPAR